MSSIVGVEALHRCRRQNPHRRRAKYFLRSAAIVLTQSSRRSLVNIAHFQKICAGNEKEAADRVNINRQSCRTTFNSELWTLKTPLYSMKPSLLNLFMKKLTRDRVVPIISANASWLTLGITASGFPSLPKLANSKRSRARRFSLELNS